MELQRHHFEQVLATRVLAESAAKVSKMFDDFAVWMLAGFAALFAFVVTQHEISPINAHQIGFCFLLAAFGTAIQKYLAIMVAAGAEGDSIGRSAIEELVERNPQAAKNLDLPAFIEYVKGGLYAPPLWIANRILKKAGVNQATSGQRLLKLAQIQGIIVIVDSALMLWALGTLFRAM